VQVPEGMGRFRRASPRIARHAGASRRYRGDQRWSLLYEVLWRVSHGDRTAMMAGDKLGSELQRRIKQVQREAHHLHAFVRFIERPQDQPGPQYVAWHEPAHDILHSASEHFHRAHGPASLVDRHAA
jgi:probable DNA metabolism protein